MYVRYVERKSGQLIVAGHADDVPVKGEFVTIMGDSYRVHRRRWYPVERFVEVILKEKRWTIF